MPCYSSVKQTNMNHATRLEEALSKLGYEVTSMDATQVAGSKDGHRIFFNRRRANLPFTTNTDTQVDRLNAVQRKYTELGVRKWARARGFAVTGFENGKMQLVNRRA